MAPNRTEILAFTSVKTYNKHPGAHHCLIVQIYWEQNLWVSQRRFIQGICFRPNYQEKLYLSWRMFSSSKTMRTFYLIMFLSFLFPSLILTSPLLLSSYLLYSFSYSASSLQFCCIVNNCISFKDHGVVWEWRIRNTDGLEEGRKFGWDKVWGGEKRWQKWKERKKEKKKRKEERGAPSQKRRKRQERIKGMKRESLTLGEHVTVHLASVCRDAPSLDPAHIEDDEMQSSGRSDQEIFQNQALGVTVRRHKPPTFRLLIELSSHLSHIRW